MAQNICTLADVRLASVHVSSQELELEALFLHFMFNIRTQSLFLDLIVISVLLSFQSGIV